jgi:hypothetical protein
MLSDCLTECLRYGGQMARPFGSPAELEAEIWAIHAPGLMTDAIKPSLLQGCRRVAKLPVPEDLTIEAHVPSGGVRFTFSLPAGAYATTFLREFVRAQDDALHVGMVGAEGAGGAGGSGGSGGQVPGGGDGEAEDDEDVLFASADAC